MYVLLTGGAGYIGSHTAVELIRQGYEVGILDNLASNSLHAVNAIRAAAGSGVSFIRGDIRDADCLDALFRARSIHAVLHFAARKDVAESARKPLSYYDTNVAGTLVLLERMAARGIRTLVFSSSAAVYGNVGLAPLRESAPIAPASPYGRSKRMVERILHDVAAADPGWRISILRYFNAAGGLPGLTPASAGSHLLPAVAQVACGLRDRLDVFGGDYPTPDGTPVRDYLHVADLAHAHARVLRFLVARPGVAVHNLGTGCGHSVLDVVRTFEAVSGAAVPVRITGRRAGDVAMACADASLAARALGWRPEHDLHSICADLWRGNSRRPPAGDPAGSTGERSRRRERL